MIKNHLKNILTLNLPFTPTNCQKKLIEVLSGYITSFEPDKIMLIKGYAGTGKTTMVFSLTQGLASLKIRSILLAPTGRAAKVMAEYSKIPAFTIHKKIYRQKSSNDGMGKFSLDKNLYKNTYFIVDEASMISNELNENSVFGSGRLLDDLLEYVYSGENCRLVLVGDTAQLPPVKLNISPALEAASLEYCGFSVKEVELKEVVRQAEDSGILFNATKIRNRISSFNDNSVYFPIVIKSFGRGLDLNNFEYLRQIRVVRNYYCYEVE
ncbi:MAG: AAA family ATPase [Draconibacterium sp.]|nr:AAA family ATPase [Draconibacterium sp.]